MIKKLKTKREPWQRGAAELLEGALEHLHRGSDANTRIAFLLFDVGVETTLKTYLKLPAKVTGTKTSYGDRKKAAEGNFHDVADGVEKAATGKLSGIDLTKVQYYHDVRNKLYHDGSGITVSTKDVNAYARIAVDLLKALLSVDLEQLLRQPEIQSKRQARLEAKNRKEKAELDAQVKAVQEARERLERVARRAIENVHPSLALPSFEDGFNALINEGIPSEQLAERMKELVSSATDSSNVISQTYILALDKSLHAFNLMTLEVVVDPTGQSSERHWAFIRFDCGNYPKKEQQPLYFPEEDADTGEITEIEIKLDHADILRKGREWVEKLDAISNMITEWAKQKQ